MRIEQTHWHRDGGWGPHSPGRMSPAPQLVLVFGGAPLAGNSPALAELRQAYPAATLFGCSTAGEIRGTQVSDDSLVATAIRFERSRIETARVEIDAPDQSYAAGQQLACALDPAGLRHAFVLSDGLGVNGSELVRGLREGLAAEVTITGGLSGDGTRFGRTFVLLGDEPRSGTVGILGLYGGQLRVGCGSLGGWDSFGPERLITRAQGNVLFELDGRSALALYKSYLGPHAAGLPSTGLLFPLSLRTRPGEPPLVRTILGIDEARQSMTFAGDMPEGSYARLMKANFDRLVDGASGAARSSLMLGGVTPELAILISCVGRKLVLQQRVEEEVEAVRGVLGPAATLTGFYSYGEISPFTPSARCELHNQTMTITTIAEAA